MGAAQRLNVKLPGTHTGSRTDLGYSAVGSQYENLESSSSAMLHKPKLFNNKKPVKNDLRNIKKNITKPASAIPSFYAQNTGTQSPIGDQSFVTLMSDSKRLFKPYKQDAKEMGQPSEKIKENVYVEQNIRKAKDLDSKLVEESDR